MDMSDIRMDAQQFKIVSRNALKLNGVCDLLSAIFIQLFSEVLIQILGEKKLFSYLVEFFLQIFSSFLYSAIQWSFS